MRRYIKGSTRRGVKVAGTTVAPFNIHAFVYTPSTASSSGGGTGAQPKKTHFAGIVSGSVKSKTGGAGDLAADVSYAFDTRDGSWRAALAFSFESETIKAGGLLRPSTRPTSNRRHRVRACV